MSLETDLLLDRWRLKRRLSVWQIVAVVAVLAAVAAGIGRGARVAALEGPHVARLSVSGIITDDRKLTDRIAGLADNASIRAVIVYIDSPGGSVSGGESIHDALALVAAKKPVVAVMAGTAASAGYMIAMPAARVFAREATITGSIGVILETGEVSGLLGKIGVSADAITSGPLKDQPSFTHPLTPQGRDVLHSLVMDLYDQFVGMVATGRHMTPDQVRALADGRAYTGRQALKLGLIDQIGDERDARAWLAANRHVDAKLPVDDLERRGWLRQNLGATLGDWLGLVAGTAVKTVLSQGVTLDGAVSLWQPSISAQ